MFGVGFGLCLIVSSLEEYWVAHPSDASHQNGIVSSCFRHWMIAQWEE